VAATDALVLSGGASLGDFEVGAVRRLFELGFAPGVISCASVGSLNAVKLAESGVLAVSAQPSGLENIWLGLNSPLDMFTNDPQIDALLNQYQGLQSDEVGGFAAAGWLLESPLFLLAPFVALGTVIQVGLDIKAIAENLQNCTARSIYNLGPIRTLLTNPSILDTTKVNNSSINILIATVSLETGELRYVNQKGILLTADAKTPYLELDAVPAACQSNSDDVAAAAAEIQQIIGSRGDYTEAGYHRALAAANLVLSKAKQALAACLKANPGSPAQVVVPIPDAVLASAGIPMIFQPVKLGQQNYVDGGIRQAAPIAGAIAAGATNIWAILANHIAVQPLPFTDSLTGVTINDYSHVNLLEITARAGEEIMPAQIEADNIAPLTGWGSATVTVVQPELDIHNGFTVDPGLIRIRMAHGYMRTDDVNTARALRGNGWADVSDTITQMLYTTEIVSLRYQIWLLEHDYHLVAPNFTRRGTLQQPVPVGEPSDLNSILTQIRGMKQQLQQLVQFRLQGIESDGNLVIVDRPIQGAVPNQPVPLSDWWLTWERHRFATPNPLWTDATPFTSLTLPVIIPQLRFSTTTTVSTTGVATPVEMVEITELTPGAKVYYTLDGSIPTQSSSEYSGAIALNPSANVKVSARAFSSDGRASLVATGP
jgi:NTE family protein